MWIYIWPVVSNVLKTGNHFRLWMVPSNNLYDSSFNYFNSIVWCFWWQNVNVISMLPYLPNDDHTWTTVHLPHLGKQTFSFNLGCSDCRFFQRQFKKYSVQVAFRKHQCTCFDFLLQSLSRIEYLSQSILEIANNMSLHWISVIKYTRFKPFIRRLSFPFDL